HAGFPDEYGIVLGPAAEDLYDALYLLPSPYDGVQPALSRLLGEVGPELREFLWERAALPASGRLRRGTDGRDVLGRSAAFRAPARGSTAEKAAQKAVYDVAEIGVTGRSRLLLSLTRDLLPKFCAHDGCIRAPPLFQHLCRDTLTVVEQ